MLLWMLACVTDPADLGGQQGEDYVPETGLAADDSDATDSAQEDSDDPADTGELSWTGSVALSSDEGSCTGPLSLDAQGEGSATCTFAGGGTWTLGFVDATRDGASLSGSLTPEGSYEGSFDGDRVSGTLQGVYEGQAFTGTFEATLP